MVRPVRTGRAVAVSGPDHTGRRNAARMSMLVNDSPGTDNVEAAVPIAASASSTISPPCTVPCWLPCRSASACTRTAAVAGPTSTISNPSSREIAVG
nr:hypothetical protein [uncultured Mycolicibacterium sp.]